MDLLRINLVKWSLYWTVVVLLATIYNIHNSSGQEIWYSVAEQQPVATLVGNLRANMSSFTKYDVNRAGSLNDVTFRLIAQNTVPPFSIDTVSGDIVTSQVIDRESLCPDPTQASCHVRFDVIVSPLPVVHTVIVKVYVTITDINDNTPEFNERRVSFRIPESTPVGASYSIKGAFDADSPAFRVQRYELINDVGKFSLKPTDYTVSSIADNSDITLLLTGALDAETRDAYVMTLTAYDCPVSTPSSSSSSSSPSQTCHSDSIIIDVTVVDVNDNYPVFDSPSYSARVREDTRIGTPVLRVAATDRDRGRNAALSFYISDSEASRMFFVANATVVDNTDYNDVIGLAAADVMLGKPLDYTEAASHVFTVTACDAGVPRLCNEVKVTVKVTGVNNRRRPPTISINTVSAADVDAVTLREDAPIGAFVAQIMAASDSAVSEVNGQGQSISCVLVDSLHFRLLGAAGEYALVTANHLPRQADHQLHLSVLVTCSDDLTSSSSFAHTSGPLVTTKVITVTLLHVNEPPYFSKSVFAGRIVENIQPGSTVMQLTADDVDGGLDGQVTFKLPLDMQHFFEIDQSTGTITTRVWLNAEERQLFLFNVSAVDGGIPALSAAATVVIAVDDVNDESPVFEQKKYLFIINQNGSQGQIIGAVRARDADISEMFSEVNYVISGDNSAPFSVHTTSGNLTITKTLDEIVDRPSAYTFVVKATDVNNMRLLDTASVVIVIEDGVDRNPMFTFPVATHTDAIHVSREATVNYVIGTLKAINVETQSSDRLVYSIVQGNDDDLFAVDALTGTLTIAASLHRATTDIYDVVVDATDSVVTSRRTEAVVRIIINESISFVPSSALLSAASGAGIGGISGISKLRPHMLVLICVGSATGMFFTIFAVVLVVMLRRGARGRSNMRRCIMLTHDNDVGSKAPPSFSSDVIDEETDIGNKMMMSQTTTFLGDDWQRNGHMNSNSCCYNGVKVVHDCKVTSGGQCRQYSCVRHPLISGTLLGARDSRNSLDNMSEVFPPLLAMTTHERNSSSPDGSTADSGRGNSESDSCQFAVTSSVQHRQLSDNDRQSPDVVGRYSTFTQQQHAVNSYTRPRVNMPPLAPSVIRLGVSGVSRTLPHVDEDDPMSPDFTMPPGNMTHLAGVTPRYTGVHFAPSVRPLSATLDSATIV